MAHIKIKPNGKFAVVWRLGGRGTPERAKVFATREEAERYKQQVEADKAFERMPDPFGTPEANARAATIEYMLEHSGEAPPWADTGFGLGGRSLAQCRVSGLVAPSGPSAEGGVREIRGPLST